MKKITLLDNKRSLAVNIFLKQLKQGTSAVIGAVHTCDSTGLTAEHLRRLLEILPDEQEVLLITIFHKAALIAIWAVRDSGPSSGVAYGQI